MKEVCYVILLLSTTLNIRVRAQTFGTDSFNARQAAKDFDALMKSADSLVDLDNVQAVASAKKAKILALRIGDTARIVYATRMVGQLENRLGNIDSAIYQFTLALPIAERNDRSDDLKKILNSMAVSFTFKGEFGKALGYHLKSLALREKAQNKKEISITLHNIASVYITSSNHEQALPYVERCLRIKQEISDSLDLDRAYLNLGICHTALGNYAKARSAYTSGLAVCEPNCSKYVLTMANYGLGEIYLRERNMIMAKQYFEKSLTLSVEANDLQMHLFSLLSLAQCANEEGDLLRFRNYLTAFESQPHTVQLPTHLRQFYALSSKYHVLTRDFRKAFEAQKKYSELSDSISGARMSKKIIDMEMEFVERENIQKIQAQQELLIAQNSSIEKQKIINLLLLGLALLTVSLIFILFKMNRRKSQTNKVLDGLVRERTIELERNGRALHQALNTQSVVLERVSRDLVSTLATIQGLSQVAEMEGSVNTQLYLRQAESSLSKSINNIRTSADLHDPDRMQAYKMQ